jgi:hypothetical protein
LISIMREKVGLMVKLHTLQPSLLILEKTIH